MQTVYLVKVDLGDNKEMLCAIFSELELADTYANKSRAINKEVNYRVEHWTMDFHV